MDMSVLLGWPVLTPPCTPSICNSRYMYHVYLVVDCIKVSMGKQVLSQYMYENNSFDAPVHAIYCCIYSWSLNNLVHHSNYSTIIIIEEETSVNLPDVLITANMARTHNNIIFTGMSMLLFYIMSVICAIIQTKAHRAVDRMLVFIKIWKREKKSIIGEADIVPNGRVVSAGRLWQCCALMWENTLILVEVPHGW